MAQMKKTNTNGTIMAKSYEEGKIIGVSLSIYGKTTPVCMEEKEDGKLYLLINDEAVNKLGLNILHVDNNWQPV